MSKKLRFDINQVRKAVRKAIKESAFHFAKSDYRDRALQLAASAAMNALASHFISGELDNPDDRSEYYIDVKNTLAPIVDEMIRGPVVVDVEHDIHSAPTKPGGYPALGEGVRITPDELRDMLKEQLGSISNTDEAQMEISLELCKAYCRMMADSFDKAARNSGKVDDVILQFEIVGRHMDSLKDEMSRAEKVAKRLSKK